MIATCLWYVSNNFLLKSSARDQDVEWGFCFDVHLNAFIPILVILHFVQLFVYHAIIGKNLLWATSILYMIKDLYRGAELKISINVLDSSINWMTILHLFLFRTRDIFCNSPRKFSVAVGIKLLHLHNFPRIQLPEYANEVFIW